MRGCLKEHKVFSVTLVDQILRRLFILFPSSHFEGVSHWLEIVFFFFFSFPSRCLIGLSLQTFVMISHDHCQWPGPAWKCCAELCACTSLNNVPAALFQSWYSLGCSLLGQGGTNPDTGCQEKTSWIPHRTLITAAVTCTLQYRMGTPELGNLVVYFNELLPLLKQLLSLLCSTERPRGVRGTKL